MSSSFERMQGVSVIKQGLNNFLCLKIENVLVDRINAYLINGFQHLASLSLYTYDLRTDLIAMSVNVVDNSIVPANSYTEELLAGNDPITLAPVNTEKVLVRNDPFGHKIDKKFNKKFKWIFAFEKTECKLIEIRFTIKQHEPQIFPSSCEDCMLFAHNNCSRGFSQGFKQCVTFHRERVLKNKGFHQYRFRDNPIEKKFALAWEENNKHGGILDYLLAKDSNHPNDEVTERDREVAATVIQWLGSPVGQSFLTEITG